MRRVSRAEKEQRVRHALEIVHMHAYAERMPNQLSGGQQQRVALARALVIEPDVVLLDEPLSNLDAKLRIEMRTQIKEIHQKIGRTMIYVTHDQAEALSMADRIAVMRRGRLVQVGTPHELYTRPESAFVAQFIGGTNLLRGTLEEIGDLLTVKTQAGVVRARNGVKGHRARRHGFLLGPAGIFAIQTRGRIKRYPPPKRPTSCSPRYKASCISATTNNTPCVSPIDVMMHAVEYNPTARKAQVGERRRAAVRSPSRGRVTPGGVG